METVIKREGLIRRVKKVLKEKNIIVIKASLGSGKTVFARQLRRSLGNSVYYYIKEKNWDDILKVLEFLKSLNKKYYIFDNFDILEENPPIKNIFINFLKENFKEKKIILLAKFISGFVPDYQILEKDLYFTRKEILEYFKSSRLKINKEILENIYSVTKGWISGVKLIKENFSKFKHGKFEIKELSFFVHSLLEKELGPELKEIVPYLALLPEDFKTEELKRVFTDESLYKEFITLIKILERKGILIHTREDGIFVHPLLIDTVKRYYFEENKELLFNVIDNIFNVYKDTKPEFLIKLFYEFGLSNYIKEILERKLFDFFMKAELGLLEKIVNSGLLEEKEKILISSFIDLKKGNFENVKRKVKKLRDFGYMFYSDYLYIQMNKLRGEILRNVRYIKRIIKRYKRRERLIFLNFLATSYLLENKFKEAIEIYKKIKIHAKKLKAKRTELSARFNLEIIKKEMGIIRPERIYRLIEEFEELKDEMNRMVAIYHFSESLYLKRKIKKANFYIEKGKKFSKFFDRFLYASFLELQGRVYMNEGKFDEAEERFISSARVLSKMNSEFYPSPLFHLYVLWTLKGKEILSIIGSLDNLLRNIKGIKSFIREPLEILYNFLYKKIYLKRKETDAEIIRDIRKMEKRGEILNSILICFYLKEICDKYDIEFILLDKEFQKLNSKRKIPVFASDKDRRKIKVFIKTLGNFAVFVNGKDISLKEIKGRKAKKIFKFMLTNFNKEIKEKEIERYFFDRKKSKNNIYFCISEIRSFLRRNNIPLEIIKNRDGYVLKGNGDIIDYVVFFKLFKNLKNKKKREEKGELIEKIEEIYSGDFLSDELTSPWADRLRKKIRETYSEVIFYKASLLKSQKEKMKGLLLKSLHYNPLNLKAFKLLYRIEEDEEEKEKIIKKFRRDYFMRKKRFPDLSIVFE